MSIPSEQDREKNGPSPVATGNTIIESLGVYLPPRVVSTKEIIASCKGNIPLVFETLTGIKSRHMAGEEEFSIDLARKAVVECLAHSKYDPQDIDLLICCNISRCDGPNFRFTFEPSTAIRLKGYFGFDNALVFDITNACPGLFTGIMLVDTFLKTGAIQRGMIVSGEYVTHLTQTAQKEIKSVVDPQLACLTLGDAGAALILEKSADFRYGFHQMQMYTVGKYSSYCIAEMTDQEHGGAIMLTDSLKLTAVSLQHAVKHTADMINQQGWTRDQVDHLIMHQTSKNSLDKAAREINRFYDERVCDDEMVIINLAKRGNTATTTHFVAVMDNILNGRIQSGDNAVFSVTGSGLTIGTALYTFDDLPDRLRQQSDPPKVEHKPTVPLRRQQPTVYIESMGVVSQDMAELNTFELAKGAVENCLSHSANGRNDLDLLLFAGVYRSRFISEPAIASMIAGQLQLDDYLEVQSDRRILAFDIFNGALGFLNACYIAVQMIEAGSSNKTLIVASEIENNSLNFPDERLGILETGSAMILEASPNGITGFGNFVFKDFTHFLDAYTAYTELKQGKPHMRFELSPRIEDLYLENIPEAVSDLLESEGLSLSQIRAIFPPQISTSFISDLGRSLNVAPEMIVDVTRGGKDYFTSSIPYTLLHARRRGFVEGGDIGLIISVGAGIQIGCAIYYF